MLKHLKMKKIILKNLSQKRAKTAFSLLELSIVILIIAVLIVGSLTASISAINNAKYKLTKERMNEIYKAMGNYLLVNKALPCPATITLTKSSSSTYGTAATTAGSCSTGSFIGGSGLSANLAYGMVPVQTLGLPADMAEDGFGNKFTYIVSRGFTDPNLTSASSGFGSITPASGFSTATAGFISVKENIAGTYKKDTDEAMFVIISHGNNKFGAYGVNSTTQNAGSTDVDEQNNYGSTTTFYNTNNYFTLSSVNSDIFDDVVFYKTRNVMLLDFNALSLITCPATTTNDASCNNGLACGWPATYYNQIVTSSDSCSTGYTSTVVKPTRRCGAFGVWQTGYINPCTQ